MEDQINPVDYRNFEKNVNDYMNIWIWSTIIRSDKSASDKKIVRKIFTIIFSIVILLNILTYIFLNLTP